MLTAVIGAALSVVIVKTGAMPTSADLTPYAAAGLAIFGAAIAVAVVLAYLGIHENRRWHRERADDGRKLDGHPSF